MCLRPLGSFILDFDLLLVTKPEFLNRAVDHQKTRGSFSLLFGPGGPKERGNGERGQSRKERMVGCWENKGERE